MKITQKLQIGENHHESCEFIRNLSISHLNFLQQLICVITVVVWIWSVHAWGCRKCSLYKEEDGLYVQGR